MMSPMTRLRRVRHHACRDLRRGAWRVALRCIGCVGGEDWFGRRVWCGRRMRERLRCGVVADVEVLNDFAGECEMGAVFVLGFSSESPRGRASSTCASSRCTRLGRTSDGCTASTAGMGDGVDAGDVVTGASRADPGGGVVAVKCLSMVAGNRSPGVMVRPR